jgi:hypothetical protein
MDHPRSQSTPRVGRLVEIRVLKPAANGAFSAADVQRRAPGGAAALGPLLQFSVDPTPRTEASLQWELVNNVRGKHTPAPLVPAQCHGSATRGW